MKNVILLFQCSVKYDTFDSLSLSIPSPHVVSRTLYNLSFWFDLYVCICVMIKNCLYQKGVLTLEYLLRRYVTSETVQNVECDGCAQLPRRRSSVHKLLQTDGTDGVLNTVTKQEDTPKPKTTFIKKLTIGKVCLGLVFSQCTCLYQTSLKALKFIENAS